MNPFELRLEIIKTAYTFIKDEYQSECNRYRDTGIKCEYPSFPSIKKLIDVAYLIKGFVGEK